MEIKMDTPQRKDFIRRMHDNSSEVGKMKLQSVKENLYEATTKVVLYSIEMYTKKELSEWARTDLLLKLDKANRDLQRERDELEQGHIGMFDITNGCSVINDFVRKDALAEARDILNKKIDGLSIKKLELEEKKKILEKRKVQLDETLNESPLEENSKTYAQAEQIWEASSSAEDFDEYESADAFEYQEENISELEDSNTDQLEDADIYEDVDLYEDTELYDDIDTLDEEDIFDDTEILENENELEAEKNVRELMFQEEETSLESDEDDEDEDDEDEDDEDDDEFIVTQPSELELFQNKVGRLKSLEDISNLLEEIQEDFVAIEIEHSKLVELTKKGKNYLTQQDQSEKEILENLRTLRNTGFAHKIEDEQEISHIGEWEPEGGPLYKWATEVLGYIKVIEARYRFYGLFDEFYRTKEGKDKFDGCKVYVQKQIKELYVNHSNVTFEFAGDLYDKDDEEYNFKKLIENMAIFWNTGIRYLTVVTNEDLPELNLFFKECLSGTNKYVDYFLIERNALRDANRKKDYKEMSYIYFRLLYHLNPSMDTLYWEGRIFSPKEYARQIIYKYIKVKNMFQFDGRLKDPVKYLGGIDVRKWCENHLLSDVYFAGLDDIKGKSLSREMEDAILDFCNNPGKGRNIKFRRVIKASVRLYFYMGKDYVFSYTRNNGQTVHWRFLEDACNYMENGKRFKSYLELTDFVEELNKSDYFKIWRSCLKKMENEKNE